LLTLLLLWLITSGHDITHTTWCIFEYSIIETYLQKLTVLFFCYITYPTQRSVENFGFLGGVLDGSSVDFQWTEGWHNILYEGLKWSLLVSLFFSFSQTALNRSLSIIPSPTKLRTCSILKGFWITRFTPLSLISDPSNAIFHPVIRATGTFPLILLTFSCLFLLAYRGSVHHFIYHCSLKTWQVLLPEVSGNGSLLFYW
jgi:hypothetical protein